MPPRARPTSKKALEGKRYPLNLRTTHDLRRRLEGASAASGRSLAQEVEYRLELSLFDSAARNLQSIARDIEIAWAKFGERFTKQELIEQELIKAVKEGNLEQAQALADVYLRTRRTEVGGER